jgi:hypothetical protein
MGFLHFTPYLGRNKGKDREGRGERDGEERGMERERREEREREERGGERDGGRGEGEHKNTKIKYKTYSCSFKNAPYNALSFIHY